MSSQEPSPKRIAELTAAARDALDELAGLDPGVLCDAGLAEQVVELTSVAQRAEAVAAATVGAWEGRGGWRPDGFATARSWLASQCELGGAGAGRALFLGRFLRSFDASCAAVTEGAVSTAAGRLLARAAAGRRAGLYARDEALLLDLAGQLGVDDLERVLRRWMVLADDELADAEAEAAYHGRSAHLSDVGDQTRLDATFDRTAGATVAAAVHHAMGRPDGPDRPGGPRTTEQRRADAIEEICRHYLATTDGDDEDDAPERRAPRTAVHVRVDLDVLTGSSADPFDPAWLGDLDVGGPVGRNTLRRLLCDSYLSRIVTRGRSVTLDAGARTRFFSDAQRDALIARDGTTCVAPGCQVPAERCDAHHLRPYEHGGASDLDNGAHLCGFHHRLVHEAHWTLHHTGVGWSFDPPTTYATLRAPPAAA